jgi:quinol monooxygenase YgiN/mannose-6-phosphate isomerase-like protein (cupin superfamily)
MEDNHDDHSHSHDEEKLTATDSDHSHEEEELTTIDSDHSHEEEDLTTIDINAVSSETEEDAEEETTDSHSGHNHSHSEEETTDSSLQDSFIVPTFTEFDRYNPDASYNKAPSYEFPDNIGLPLTRNFNFEDFVKSVSGDNPLGLENGEDLAFYAGLPQLDSEGSYQWDSFPAGEAQQFLTTSVDVEIINNYPPLSGDDDTPVTLDAISTSELERPLTISTTVTPWNSGPIPHIHWAEDEWFIILQGEIDSWVMSPTEDAYDLYEFPTEDDIPPDYEGPALTADKIETFNYAHLTPGQAVFLPRGYGHAYRNASPNGEPLVFLTIWSRDIENGYPAGGIEEFFTLSQPRIGRFYDTSEDAASYGNLYNKTLGSEDATSNQQRFVDYKNTFPDYYVAMSGNFGNFLDEGGNWNPAISKDYDAVPLAPPDAWNPDLPEPWNVSPGDPGADDYFPAPSPNAPSDSVNFATPFDPQVIKRIYITLDNQAQSEQLEQILATYTTDTEEIEGNFYSTPYQDPNNPLKYFVIEKWNEYSEIDGFIATDTYTNFLSQVDAIGTTSVEIDTIQPDKAASGDVSDITVVGIFQAKSGTRNQMIEILTELQANTVEESGAITFEFYENPLQADEWILFQKYIDGEATTFHFSQSYFKEFDSIFGNLLVGNGVADGNAVFYVTDEPSSNFYVLQKQGLNVLTQLFQSAPQLQISLETDNNGILDVVNGAGTGGIGIVLSLSTDSYAEVPVEYGIFTVDDVSGSIDGVSPNDPGYLDKVRSISSNLFSTNVNNAEGITISRDIFVETSKHYAFYQITNGSIEDSNPNIQYSFANNNFFTSSGDSSLTATFANGLGISAQLSGPTKGLNAIIADRQTEGEVIVDTSTLVNKDLTVEIQISRNADYTSVQLGFYEVQDVSGSILDPLTGTSIAPSNSDYSATILSDGFEKISFDLSEMGEKLANTKLNSEFAGGKLYAPFIVVDDLERDESIAYYGYAEANHDSTRHIISLGNNKFGIEDIYEGGDMDFNDIVLSLNFNFSEPPYAIA